MPIRKFTLPIGIIALENFSTQARNHFCPPVLTIGIRISLVNWLNFRELEQSSYLGGEDHFSYFPSNWLEKKKSIDSDTRSIGKRGEIEESWHDERKWVVKIIEEGKINRCRFEFVVQDHQINRRVDDRREIERYHN